MTNEEDFVCGDHRRRVAASPAMAAKKKAKRAWQRSAMRRRRQTTQRRTSARLGQGRAAGFLPSWAMPIYHANTATAAQKKR